MNPIDFHPNKTKLRQFGWISLFGFGAIGALCKWKFGVEAPALIFWCLAIVSPLFSLIAPKVLKPVYITLSLIAFPIGFIINLIVVGFLFYAIFTPFALTFKLIGRDSMHRSFDKSAETYFASTKSRNALDYYKQF